MMILGLINTTIHSDKTLKAVDTLEGQNPKSWTWICQFELGPNLGLNLTEPSSSC